MAPRRLHTHAASHNIAASAFDRITFTAFMLTTTAAAAAALCYGPAAAVQHIADVLYNLPSLPFPDSDMAYLGQVAL